jgi:hypothetical protein
MGRAELYALSMSGNKWSKWTMTEVQNELVAKGFLPENTGMNPAISALSSAVLQITASLPVNAAVAADTLRAVTVGLDIRKAGHMLEAIGNNVKEILGL